MGQYRRRAQGERRGVGEDIEIATGILVVQVRGRREEVHTCICEEEHSKTV